MTDASLTPRDLPALIARPLVFPLAAAAASAALILGAVGFEVFGGLYPCPMCMTQRWIHAGIAAAGAVMAALFAVLPAARRFAWAGAAALAAGYAWSALYAGRHALIEYGVIPAPDCAAAGTGALSAADLLDDLSRTQVVVACDEAAWTLFGVSMAGWNALASLAAAGLCLYVGWRRFRRQP